MKIFKILLVMVSIAGMQATAQELEVSKISYTDLNGIVVVDIANTITEKSLLLIVDANRMLTQTLLAKLQAAKVDWKDHLIIAVVGSIPDAKSTMKSFNIAGAKWYATPGGKTAAAFKVAGTPIAVGLHAGGATAWKVMGESQISDSNFAKIRGWLAPAPIVK